MAGVIFSDLFYEIAPKDVGLILIFVVIFLALSFFTGRVQMFQRNRAMRTVIIFCISLLSIYGISRSSFRIDRVFLNIGMGQDLLYTLLPIFLIGFIVFLAFPKIRGRRKFRLYPPLTVLGALFLLLSAIGIFYQVGAGILIGLILLVPGLIFWWRRRKWDNVNEDEKNWSARKTNKQKMLDEMKLKKKDEIKYKKRELEEKRTRKQRQQRLRSERELNKKYQSYSNAIQYLQKKNNGKMPPLGTSDGNLRHRYIQAMKAVENLAAKQGVKLKSVRKI